MALSPLSPYRNLLRTGMRLAWAALIRIRIRTHELRQRLPSPVKRIIRRIGRITAGSMAWIGVGIVVLFVIAHFWLPTLANKKSEIEQYLSQAIGNPVQLGDLDTYWDGLNPGIRILDLNVLTVGGEPALQLRAAELSLSWQALLFGNVEINNLTLIGPQLTIERLFDGKLRITGLSMQSSSSETLPDFSNWLLRQRRMTIVDGVVTWADRAAPAGRDMVETLVISSVRASIQNTGKRHEFNLIATFPDSVCTQCQLNGFIEGNPLTDNSWSGELRVQGQISGLQNLPGVARQRLPEGIRGAVGGLLTSSWRNGQLEALRGNLRMRDLSLPASNSLPSVTLRQMETGLQWTTDNDRGRLRLTGLRLAQAGSVWQVGTLELDLRKDGGRLTAEHVNIAEVAAFLSGHSRAEPLQAWLREAGPRGWLHQLQFEWAGALTAPAHYRFESHVSGIQTAASGVVPGLSGLSGKLKLAPEEGEFRLDSHNGLLELPRILYKSIPFARWSGRLRWRRDADQWFVEAGDLDFRNADLRVHGDVELRIPDDRQQSPVIKLAMSLRDGNGNNASRYFPRVMHENLRSYLTQAIQGGRVTQATVEMQGALASFPYRNGDGKFEVRAQVRNSHFEFLPGWAPLRNMDLDMRFTGVGMLLTAGSGTLHGLHVSRVAVEIENFKAEEGAVLTVRAHASGSAADAEKTLRESNTPKFKSWLLPGLHIAGQGSLDLELQLPLRNMPGMMLDGEYRISGGQLVHESLQEQPVDNLRGMIGFNQAGLRSGRLEGRWLNNLLEMEATEIRGGTSVLLNGAISPAKFAELLGPALSRQLNGLLPWRLQWLVGEQKHQLEFEADLEEVEIKLPAPLEKARGDKLIMHGHSLGMVNGKLRVQFDAGNRASSVLVWASRPGELSFQGGRIAIGEKVTELANPDGLHVSARLPAIDVDRWWPVLESEVGQGTSSAIKRVSLDTDALHFLDRAFGRLTLDLTRGPGYWSGRLEGESVVGRGVITPASAVNSKAAHTGVQLSLERLILPASLAPAQSGNIDPRRLPALQIRSDSFRYDQYDLGSLDFSAEPSYAGLRIHTLKLKRENSEIRGRGMWLTNYQGKQSSRVEFLFESDNLGGELTEFGFGSELVGGKISMQSSWEWPGAPGKFSLATLNGSANIEMKSGQLPGISPGAGRLFGAFDLRSVTRILALDFSALVSKGLAFDNVRGRLEVTNGNAQTRNLSIQIPGADVELQGRIGLASRDLDLTMEVIPRVSSNLAPVIGATILGGPVAGGAVAVIGGVTRKPIEKSARSEYTVKGEWEDPVVTPVQAPVTEGAESAQ